MRFYLLEPPCNGPSPKKNLGRKLLKAQDYEQATTQQKTNCKPIRLQWKRADIWGDGSKQRRPSIASFAFSGPSASDRCPLAIGTTCGCDGESCKVCAANSTLC
mmetsp:Transcript_26371/g.43826  ORF Transcript_26371/g.43826 Transcript_26371/m.43826 type:complete len:104 (-) Transcript_26371:712-1023(-)